MEHEMLRCPGHAMSPAPSAEVVRIPASLRRDARDRELWLDLELHDEISTELAPRSPEVRSEPLRRQVRTLLAARSGAPGGKAVVISSPRPLTRFRLRHGSEELALSPGEFTVGRSSACNLQIDDSAISRKHCAFHVAKDGVEVEDLASRNGVLLNGTPVQGRVSVHPGDRITLGTVDVWLLDKDTPLREGRDTMLDPIPAAVRRSASRPQTGSRDPESTNSTGDETKPGSSVHAMLVTVADKALGLGQLEEAGRVTERLMEGLRTFKARQIGIDAFVFKSTARFVLDLAERTSNPRWIGLLLEAHALAERLPDGKTVDALYDLVHRLHFHDSESLRTCLDALRVHAHAFGPNERFVFKRLEGLGRVISA